MVLLWINSSFYTFRLGSVLRVTRKTDQQLEYFNVEFKRIHRQYQGFRDNCQVYAGGFVDFLMEDGERERDLPALESPLTLELALSTILAVVLGVFIPYIVDMLT